MTELTANAINIRTQRQIALWLLVCCALVFFMVVLGGITRLTGSGLSMVEWKPIFGILPPLDQTDWQRLFEKYQQSPEFRKINFEMDLEGFKGIFWLEYLHRILGRLIGIVFLVPFLFFWLTRKIPGPLVPKLITLFVLGGLQGLLGWYMVKSGLIDNPHVSQYRLTAHLLLAVLVYGYMLWTALDLLLTAKADAHPEPDTRFGLGFLKGFTYTVAALIVFTMASGGFVAGLKAGFAYNTFPLMAGQWVPEGLFTLEPGIRNLFDNVTTVQFNHRILAVLVLILVVLLWFVALRRPFPLSVRYGFHALLLVGILQVALGISTLLLYVPISLASMHQAGALVLFTIALFLAHRLRHLDSPVAAEQAIASQTL